MLLVGACRVPNPAWEAEIEAEDGAVPDRPRPADGPAFGRDQGTGEDGPPVRAEVGADLGKSACTPDQDGDGYGPGGGCLAPDCDDRDPTVADSATRACYTGPPGTMAVGVCRPGVEVCRAGHWSGCSGQVAPTGESCNGQDDDCDGLIDEQLGNLECGLGACARTMPACTAGVVGRCPPAPAGATLDGCGNGDEDCDGTLDEDCQPCLRVAPTGDDARANGSPQAPFGTIQAAIDYAAANPAVARIVCVAGGRDCNERHTYSSPPGRPLRMASGVSVFGLYESTGWKRCGSWVNGAIVPSTAISLDAPEGVLFPSSVAAPTGLDGFRLERVVAPTTAAVTVEGAKMVNLSRLVVADTPDVETSYGVNIFGGGEAAITRSAIYAGNGRVQAIGVRVSGGKVALRENCRTITDGRCAGTCGPGTEQAIRGRLTSSAVGASYGVLLTDAPGSSIEQTAVCGNDAQAGAAVKITGNAAGVLVRGSFLSGAGGDLESHGILLEGCKNTSPWLVDNHTIEASGGAQGARAAAVRVVGDCHPVIQGNLRIVGAAGGPGLFAAGVHCGADGQGAISRCIVQDNELVVGSVSAAPPASAGVLCDPGSCGRISGNVVEGGAAADTHGLWLERTGPLVDGNLITGGCGSKASAGVLAHNAFARLENNRIFGARCGSGGPAPGTSVGLRVRTEEGGGELDVHSNFIDGAGAAGACQSVAVDLAPGVSAPGGRAGSFRNNILRGGVCRDRRAGLVAGAPGLAPRTLEHNDFDPANAPVLYLAGDNAVPLDDINRQAGAVGNVSVDPRFSAYPADLRLQSGSGCIDRGTATGAPARDATGKLRSPPPDIGPYER